MVIIKFGIFLVKIFLGLLSRSPNLCIFEPRNLEQIPPTFNTKPATDSQL